MFEVYEVEAWRLFGGWVLFAIAALVGAVGWRMAYILNKSNGDAQSTIASAKETVKVLKEKKEKAEANAREAEAGHQECARKLEAEQVESAKWRSLALAYGERMPKRRKDGKFAPKSGKTGEKKKVKNPRAKS